MKLFLGVDGGQSSTVALIADETGKVLGAGRGGPCNHVAASEGRAKFKRAIDECLANAYAQAGLSPDNVSFEVACLGFSGGAADKEAYSREFIRSKTFKITHDAEIALTGATGGDPGIIVIAGTGSIAFGKNSTGQTARAGGWGYIFGDEGGAFDLVRQAMRAALAIEEGWGGPTVLYSRMLSSTNSKSANQLLHSWYNQFNRSQIATLAPLVDEAAMAGDLVAGEIMKQSALHLFHLVTHLQKLLFDRENPGFVSYIGGVFKSKLLSDEFAKLLQKNLGCGPVPPRFPAAAGALIEALGIGQLKVSLSQVPDIKT